MVTVVVAQGPRSADREPSEQYSRFCANCAQDRTIAFWNCWHSLGEHGGAGLSVARRFVFGRSYAMR
jgi:hypothetical protein